MTDVIQGAFGTRAIIRSGDNSVDVVLTIEAVEAAALAAFAYANATLGAEARKEAHRVKWEWPGNTRRRRDKKLAGSPRNIVDTGTFAARIIERQEANDPTTWNHIVGVEYAAPVLLGYRVRTRDGWRNMPGRNVYREPLERGFGRWYEAEYRRQISRLPPTPPGSE